MRYGRTVVSLGLWNPPKGGHVHYLTPELLITKRAHENLSLVEVEQRTTCKARGCRGKMRMAMTHASEISGFVGGLA